MRDRVKDAIRVGKIETKEKNREIEKKKDTVQNKRERERKKEKKRS